MGIQMENGYLVILRAGYKGIWINNSVLDTVCTFTNYNEELVNGNFSEDIMEVWKIQEGTPLNEYYSESRKEECLYRRENTCILMRDAFKKAGYTEDRIVLTRGTWFCCESGIDDKDKSTRYIHINELERLLCQNSHIVLCD